MEASSSSWCIAGVDMSAQPKRTAVARFEFGPGDRIVLRQQTGVDDAALTTLMQERSTVVGIDAPLGWPMAFIRAVTGWHAGDAWTSGPDPADGYRNLKFRLTDDRAQRHGVEPRASDWPNGFSVAADKIAVTTFRTLACVKDAYAPSGDRPDITGVTGRLVEVWPSVSLAALGIRSKGYKHAAKGLGVRQQIVERITDALASSFGTFDSEESGTTEDIRARLTATDHALDAAVAALTAWAAVVGNTTLPADDHETAHAAVEGWIHVPSSGVAGASTSIASIVSRDPVPFLEARLQGAP